MAYTPIVADPVAGRTSAPWPSARFAWGFAFVLALASAASHADRVVLNLAIKPVKTAFALTDTQYGMLQGIAFGIFYMLCSLPIGRMADTYQRRLVLAVSLTLFSMFSMASGFARNFGQLFVTRVGVGIGEASVTPTGMSLLADLFPPERLGRAASLFYLSTPLGFGMAFVAGGALLTALDHLAGQGGLPFHLAPWQAVFLIVGFPGLLLVPIFLAFREPVRRGRSGDRILTIREMAGVMKERAGVLTLMIIGFSMVPVVNIGFNTWTPALFERIYGWTPGQFGLAFGLLLMTCGVGGVAFAGWFSDRLMKAGRTDAPLRVAAWSFLLSGLLAAVAPLMPSATAALFVIAPAIFLSNIPLVCAGIGFQLIVPNRARAQVTGLFIMVTGLVGQGIGPVLIGIMNDHLFPGTEGVRYSMAIVFGSAAPLMTVLLLIACRQYRRFCVVD